VLLKQLPGALMRATQHNSDVSMSCQAGLAVGVHNLREWAGAATSTMTAVSPGLWAPEPVDK
jgi:hypothetical protein